MIEDKEIKGEWWLPGEPDKKLPGTLFFSPEKGLSLELQGLFKDEKALLLELQALQNGEIYKPAAYGLVLGFSLSGTKITLRNCSGVFSRLHYPGIHETTFAAEVGFIGAHFLQPEEIKFQGIKVRYDYLDEWIDLRVLDFPCGFPGMSGTIKYETPEPIEVELGNGIRVVLGVNVDTSLTVGKEFSVRRKSFVAVEPEDGLSFEEVRKYIRAFQRLLALFVGRPVYPLEVSAEALTVAGEARSYTPVDVIYQYRVAPPPAGGRREFTRLSGVWCPYRLIEGRIESVARNWIEKSERLGPVYDLFFSTVYSGNTDLEFRLLSLVAALEVYHRRTMRNEEVPREEHEKRLNEILSSVPDQHREWLEERLRYSNEPRLRKRIKEIYDSLSGIRYVAQRIPKRDDFVNKVVTTRNYLAHYNHSLEESALRGGELHSLVANLEFLIRLCLLREVGFADSEIDEILSENEKCRVRIEVREPGDNDKKQRE